MNNITVRDFLHTNVRDYALYVLYERAIPLFEDGLKPTKRKLLYSALKSGYKKEKKTLPLIGYTIAMTEYAHGNASLEDTLNNMVKNYIPYNNIPLFSSTNAFGNRSEPTAPQPRYTSVRLSEHFSDIFEKDIDLIEYINNDNLYYDYFIPLIPYTLLNGESGIATGFSMNMYGRDIKEIIKYIISFIEGKNPRYKMLPYFKGFKGEISYDEKNDKFNYDIKLNRKGRKIIIDEVSPFYNRKSMIKILNKLRDEKKILTYKDISNKNPKFEIKLKVKISDEDIKNELKLTGSFSKDNITIIKNDGVKVYDDIFHYTNDWVKWRLSKFDDRKNLILKRLKERGKEIKAKYNFIKYCMSKCNLSKMSKNDYDNIITELSYQEYKNKLINIPIYEFSKDGLEKLKNQYSELKKEYKIEKNKESKDEYIKELKQLLKKYR